MEPVDIKTKNGEYGGVVVGSEDMKPRGIEKHLYGDVLDKIGLDPAKLKIGDEFKGKIKFKIESLAANCVGIEITHMGIEEEPKEKGFMSSAL